MKRVLIFEDDDQDQFTAAIHGIDFWFCLWDLDQWLRSQIKYSDKTEFEEIRDELYNIMHKHGVNLDMVS